LTTSSTTSSNSQKDNDEIFFGYSTSDSEHDGVVLFGDDENWYTLSYTFRFSFKIYFFIQSFKD